MKKRNRPPHLAVATGVVFVTLSGFASASPTSAAPTSPVGAAGLSPTNHSDQPLDTASATQLITTTTLRQMQTISNALTSRIMTRMGPPPKKTAASGRQSGLAAGAAGDKVNVWGNASGDSNKYNDGVNVFDTNAANMTLGADYALTPALSLGLSAAFDRSTGNYGTTGAPIGYTASGYSLAPYLGWQINKDWALDAIVGWGGGDFDAAGNVTSDADRIFYGTNLTYATWYDNWQVIGKGSYLHGEEKYDSTSVNGVVLANSATKNKIGQWRLGAQAGYWMNGMMPFFGVAYTTDSGRSTAASVTATDNLGKHAMVWTLGINFISMNSGVTGGIVYNNESGRSNSKSDSLMANINYRF